MTREDYKKMKRFIRSFKNSVCEGELPHTKILIEKYFGVKFPTPPIFKRSDALKRHLIEINDLRDRRNIIIHRNLSRKKSYKGILEEQEA